MTDRKREIDKLPLDKLIEFWERIKDEPSPERMRAEAKRNPKLAAECAFQAEKLMEEIDCKIAHDTLTNMLNADPTLARFLLKLWAWQYRDADPALARAW